MDIDKLKKNNIVGLVVGLLACSAQAQDEVDTVCIKTSTGDPAKALYFFFNPSEKVDRRCEQARRSSILYTRMDESYLSDLSPDSIFRSDREALASDLDGGQSKYGASLSNSLTELGSNPRSISDNTAVSTVTGFTTISGD